MFVKYTDNKFFELMYVVLTVRYWGGKGITKFIQTGVGLNLGSAENPDLPLTRFLQDLPQPLDS